MSSLLGIIGRERMLIDVLAKRLNDSANQRHEVTEPVRTARGATFRVRLFDGPEPAGRIARARSTSWGSTRRTSAARANRVACYPMAPTEEIPMTQFVAHMSLSPGSHSYVYFQADTRASAATQLDVFLRSNCIDPAVVLRLGWAFDAFDGRWLLTQAEELAAEFGRDDLPAVVEEALAVA